MGVGSIVCKAAVEKTEEKKFSLTVPASCGPYVISEHIPKQRVIFSRNPEWTGPMPDFDEIQCIVVEDSNAAELAFEAGELDIIRIESSSIPRYRDNPPADTKLKIAGHLNHSWIGMNTEHPKLGDIRVRKAIQRAIDIEKIQNVVYKGVTETAHGVIPPGIIGRRAESGYQYDLDEARALLKEAGIQDLALDIVTLNKNRQHLLAAQIIQSNLKEVGITVKILPLDPGPYWSLGREKKGDAWKDSQMWIMAFGGTVDPSGYFQWFVKDQIGNWNWERWTLEEFDELYKQGVAESDPQKRAEIYIRMQEIMEDTGAYVWLNHDPEAFIHKSSIEPAIDPEGVYLFPSTRKL
jgi:peptide/nickel transport system substrate-binding protein